MVALDDTRTAAACTGVPPFLVYVCALPCLCVCKSELLALIPEMHADIRVRCSSPTVEDALGRQIKASESCLSRPYYDKVSDCGAAGAD